NLGELHLWLSLVYDRLQDRDNALRSAQAASRLFTDKVRRSESLEAEAQMHIAANRYADALPLLDAAQDLLKTLDVPPDRRGVLDFKRGDALNGLEHHREAERHARVALSRFDDARLPADHEYWAYAALVLGE
ncbi:hypothetical protein, partial [Nannocystis pusilla]|uniref:hypothetical protein n=1 Tax=Nannocystis pusilla TaxID=889268 RepID=UPI003BF000FD